MLYSLALEEIRDGRFKDFDIHRSKYGESDRRPENKLDEKN